MFLLTIVPGDLYAETFIDTFGTLEEIRAESIEDHDQSYYWHEFYPVNLSGFSDEIPF